METRFLRLAQATQVIGCLGFFFILSGCGEVVTRVSDASASETLQPASPPPSITSQPANITVTLGQTATFSVTAIGTGTLTYQWQMNSINIAGATASSYTTPATSAADDGATFDVVVTNTAGSATSTSATLTVTTPAVASYYVATNGSDTADGSASSPFATL